MRVCIFKDKRSLFRGWSRLCLHTASTNALDAVSATASTVEREARANAEEKKAVAAGAAADIATSSAALREQVRVAEREVRAEQEKRGVQLVRRCFICLFRRLTARQLGSR